MVRHSTWKRTSGATLSAACQAAFRSYKYLPKEQGDRLGWRGYRTRRRTAKPPLTPALSAAGPRCQVHAAPAASATRPCGLARWRDLISSWPDLTFSWAGGREGSRGASAPDQSRRRRDGRTCAEGLVAATSRRKGGALAGRPTPPAPGEPQQRRRSAVVAVGRGGALGRVSPPRVGAPGRTSSGPQVHVRARRRFRTPRGAQVAARTPQRGPRSCSSSTRRRAARREAAPGGGGSCRRRRVMFLPPQPPEAMGIPAQPRLVTRRTYHLSPESALRRAAVSSQIVGGCRH
eukprot:scaffold2051_cov389-Prasinococcus_capsulatus_cf.AAC.6